MEIQHNGEHVRPLPTQDISESQDSQTTQEIRNTDAGSGLHDASCCASDIVLEDMLTEFWIWYAKFCYQRKPHDIKAKIIFTVDGREFTKNFD